MVRREADTGLPGPFRPMPAFFVGLAVLSITALARNRTAAGA